MILNSSTHLSLRSPSNSVKFHRRSLPITASASTCLASPKMASSSLYEVLGISKGASNQDIKSAYRRLARICHPDAASDSSPAEFIKIHAAYSTLSDPEKRADYDRRNLNLRVQRNPGGYSGGGGGGSDAVYSRFEGYPRRNWETDQCW